MPLITARPGRRNRFRGNVDVAPAGARRLGLSCPVVGIDGAYARGSRLVDRALVLTRDEAVAAGWFGPLREGYAERIGEVVAAMLGPCTLLDSTLLRPEVLALRGHHGSITDAETAIPLLVGRA